MKRISGYIMCFQARKVELTLNTLGVLCAGSKTLHLCVLVMVLTPNEQFLSSSSSTSPLSFPDPEVKSSNRMRRDLAVKPPLRSPGFKPLQQTHLRNPLNNGTTPLPAFPSSTLHSVTGSVFHMCSRQASNPFHPHDSHVLSFSKMLGSGGQHSGFFPYSTSSYFCWHFTISCCSVHYELHTVCKLCFSFLSSWNIIFNRTRTKSEYDTL